MDREDHGLRCNRTGSQEPRAQVHIRRILTGRAINTPPIPLDQPRAHRTLAALRAMRPAKHPSGLQRRHVAREATPFFAWGLVTFIVAAYVHRPSPARLVR
eukprot:121375-Alexandrium_andersonii.AAC.1